MEFVRRIVESSMLDFLVLPDSLKNQKVEVIVLPLESKPLENKFEENINLLDTSARDEIFGMPELAFKKYSRQKKL